MADKPVPSPAPAPPKTLAPKPRNPAFRMMGLPSLPKKLPSRNWLIFWAVTGSISGAIIYDRREKVRATQRWRRAVAPLAQEPLTSADQLPRRLTIYIEAPPGDGLRAAQDHFIEYVKPVLGASGLDWEFVQGREQGDVRAVVAERIRRARRETERPDEEVEQTEEKMLELMRQERGLAPYQGIKGDIIIGRHTWKEYVRGLHEGWLGPLDAPQKPQIETPAAPAEDAQTGDDGDAEKKKDEDKKPDRPPQPPPYNTPEEYPSAALPSTVPAELPPSAIIPFPHRLGFSNTPIRLGWFLTRRKLADSVGREVAAACFAATREWREADGQYEQHLVLGHEEADWPKRYRNETAELASGGGASSSADATPATAAPAADDDAPASSEKTWTSPLAGDARIMSRMRRFEVRPELEAAAAAVVVPEADIEGSIKRSMRSLWRWGASAFEAKPKGPNIGNIDE